MFLVETYNNVLDNRKEEVVMTPLSDIKSLTEYFEKGTEKIVRY